MHGFNEPLASFVHPVIVENIREMASADSCVLSKRLSAQITLGECNGIS